MSGAAAGSATVLDTILESTRREVAQRKLHVPQGQLQVAIEEGAAAAPGRFGDALAGPQLAVIAEFKRRSPSAGDLRSDLDPGQIAAAYERGGASAVSILTEGPHFGGSLDDLRAARAHCRLPLLRKDFIVEEYQLYEAVLYGAQAVLLIVGALGDDELSRLHATATALGLDVLVEVHDPEQLRRALAAGAGIIGINNRDLRDFTVDMGTTLRLMPEIPDGVIAVSESGVHSSHQLAELAAAGVHAVLVGGSLMRSPQPEAALAALLGGAPGAQPN